MADLLPPCRELVDALSVEHAKALFQMLTDPSKARELCRTLKHRIRADADATIARHLYLSNAPKSSASCRPRADGFNCSSRFSLFSFFVFSAFLSSSLLPFSPFSFLFLCFLLLLFPLLSLPLPSSLPLPPLPPPPFPLLSLPRPFRPLLSRLLLLFLSLLLSPRLFPVLLLSLACRLLFLRLSRPLLLPLLPLPFVVVWSSGTMHHAAPSEPEDAAMPSRPNISTDVWNSRSTSAQLNLDISLGPATREIDPHSRVALPRRRRRPRHSALGPQWAWTDAMIRERSRSRSDSPVSPVGSLS